MVQRTWTDNAAEFAALTKQGKDVRLALLVACSVEKGGKEGVTTVTPSGKVTLRAFAEQAGTGAPRVGRHLDAWNALADDGLVPHSSTLKPEDADTLEISEDAIAAFDSNGLGTSSAGSVKKLTGTVRRLIVEDPDFREKIITPDTVEAIVTDAVEDPHHHVAAARALRDAAVRKEGPRNKTTEFPQLDVLDSLLTTSQIPVQIAEYTARCQAAAPLTEQQRTAIHEFVNACRTRLDDLEAVATGALSGRLSDADLFRLTEDN